MSKILDGLTSARDALSAEIDQLIGMKASLDDVIAFFHARPAAPSSAPSSMAEIVSRLHNRTTAEGEQEVVYSGDDSPAVDIDQINSMSRDLEAGAAAMGETPADQAEAPLPVADAPAGTAEGVDLSPAPSASDDVPPPPSCPKVSGPYPDAAFEWAIDRMEDGWTIKRIVAALNVVYNCFSAQFKRWRESARAASGEDVIASIPRTGVTSGPTPTRSEALRDAKGALVRDPDADRAASNWSIDDDISLLEGLVGGKSTSLLAETFGVIVEDIGARYRVLVPDACPLRQARVLEHLRLLRDTDAQVAAE